MPKGIRKSKGPQIKQISKVCMKCNKNKPLINYYVNSENRNGLFKENFCKDCFNDFVIDKSTLQEYCKLNNREFREDLWIWSCNKANETLNKNDEYLSMKDIQEKEKIYFDTVRRNFACQMNQSQYYHFIPFTDNENLINSVEKEIRASKGIVSDITDEDEEKFYSQKWHGNFTQSELDYLEEYFEGLQRDFDINNANYVDTAKKVCKASLLVDKSFNDMLAGVSGADKRWKDAQGVYNTLSEAAKFSEKTSGRDN